MKPWCKKDECPLYKPTKYKSVPLACIHPDRHIKYFPTKTCFRDAILESICGKDEHIENPGTRRIML